MTARRNMFWRLASSCTSAFVSMSGATVVFAVDAAAAIALDFASIACRVAVAEDLIPVSPFATVPGLARRFSLTVLPSSAL